ncbi:thioesterase II family protein [Actinophytocola sp.]|uniref:thioesterase II family protein n=1 Tax=Actinophytocola sp. TaxID=1872138 RepID=UPI002D7E69EC|nr:alpha/beta fold hydrolase [Actinophytocola sp.]HET9143881.1 alpha/beta fold hydrolase [Actinophytocola sp.]
MADAQGGSWIRRFHPAPDRPVRVVFLPHAGGSASYYFPFSRELSARADVLSVQYPGRQDRLTEPLLDDVADLADGVTTALLPWLDRPTILFGHSLGATIAYEVARRLEHDKSVVPQALVVSGRRAPADLRNQGGHTRDDDFLLAELAEMSGTDSQVLAEPELIKMILPVLRSDYHAAESYTFVAGPPLSCPLLVLTGDADSRVSVAEARNWSEYTTGPSTVEVFPGGHFYLADHREAVLATLAPYLS